MFLGNAVCVETHLLNCEIHFEYLHVIDLYKQTDWQPYALLLYQCILCSSCDHFSASYVLPPSQITVIFSFSRYITFSMYLDIIYI
jgi:hypothetical protein